MEYAPRLLSVSSEMKECDEQAFGKVIQKKRTLSIEMKNGLFHFLLSIHTKGIANPMTIVYIAFRPDIPDRYFPVEELRIMDLQQQCSAMKILCRTGKRFYKGGKVSYTVRPA